jgi:hypothetical protein
MPSPSLRRARPLVRAFSMGHDLPYLESSLTCSYTQMLRYPARRRGQCPSARPDSRGETVIILGVILLIAGFLLKISILWTIGIILVVIGVILAILGATGHAIAGRRHFF